MTLKPVYVCNHPGCYKHATHSISTQFSGTLYFCTQHVDPQDWREAVSLVIEPLNTTMPTPKNTYYYYTPEPGNYHCEITTPEGITYHGKASTQNKARLAAEATMPQPPQDELKQALEDALEYGSSHPSNKMKHEKVQYLLDKLQEEAAEVIQAVSKIRRFGPYNHHPDRTTTNLQELVGELEDFQAIVWALEDVSYLDPKPSHTETIKKFNKL